MDNTLLRVKYPLIMFEKMIQTTINGLGDSDAHTLTLFALILQNKCRNILELGVRSGGTTIPMFYASKILNSTLTSVDIDVPIFDYQSLENDYSNYRFAQSDSIQFLNRQVNDGVLYDFIHIDDWHDGKHVIEELKMIAKLTTNTSIITLHDAMAHTYPVYKTDEGEGEFGNGGVYRALKSLDPNIWEYCTIPVCHGLTILRKI